MAQNKIFPKSIENLMQKYPIGSQEGKGFNAKVILKVFNPYGAGTWLITEGERLPNGDWRLFGYCKIQVWEWGYCLLSELLNTRINIMGMPMHLERELYDSGGKYTVADLIKR